MSVKTVSADLVFPSSYVIARLLPVPLPMRLSTLGRAHSKFYSIFTFTFAQNADAVIAAYAHRPPNITRSDIECYFTPAVELYIPVFGVSHLSDILDPILADAISHSSVSTVTTIISCWLAECHREFGRISPSTF